MNFGKSQLRWTHTEMNEKIARHTRPMGYKIIKLIYFELLSDKHGAQCTCRENYGPVPELQGNKLFR